MKAFVAGAAAVVLLAPGAAVLGVATLISPATAGSSSCLWDDPATGSLSVSGPVPPSLTAVNGHGETVTLSQQQLTRAATIIAVGTSESVPARGQLIALMTALTESSLKVLSNTSAYPESGQLPHDGNGGGPRLARPLPAATRRRVGKREEPDGPSLVLPRLLRRTQRAEPRLAPRPPRHRWLAHDGPRRCRAGRAGLRLSRSVRRQPAHRREGADHPRRHLTGQLRGLRTERQRPAARTCHRGSRAPSSQLRPPSSASRTSGEVATSKDLPEAVSTAPASSSTPPIGPRAGGSGSPTTPATRSASAKASPGPTSSPAT